VKLTSPLEVRFHYFEQTNLYIPYLLEGGMAKVIHGKLSDKNAFIAVAISLSAVTFFIQFGVF